MTPPSSLTFAPPRGGSCNGPAEPDPCKGWRRMAQAILTALLAVAALSPARAADEPSAAEQLLFNAPHLQGLQAPRKLVYHYDESDDGKTTREDEVRMDLQPDSSGACCKVQGSFLSGPAAMALPEIDAARSNPVLLYFLEYEVRRLARATGGTAAHFRRRLREAFVHAQVLPAPTAWQGRTVVAKAVQIAPFEDDPFRNRFEDQAQTRYRFLLSDEVPGGFLQLSSTLPARRAGDPPRHVERVQLLEDTLENPPRPSQAPHPKKP